MNEDTTMNEEATEETTSSKSKSERNRLGVPGAIGRTTAPKLVDPRPPSEGGSIVIVGLDTNDGPEHVLYSVTARHENLPRSFIDDIKLKGIQVPPDVRPNGPYSEVVVGRRRVIGLRIANKELVAEGHEPHPLTVNIFRGTDDELVERMLAENSMRREETPLEMARLANRLLTLNKPKKDVARVCGYESINALNDLLALLDLDVKVQKMIGDKLSAHSARQLTKLPREEQVEAAKKLVSDAANGGPKATAHRARELADPNATIAPKKKELKRLVEALVADAKKKKGDRHFEVSDEALEFGLGLLKVVMGDWKRGKVKGLTAALAGEVSE